MPDERIRTVVATLIEPTAHKEQKLRRLQSTYREALHDTVETGATTMTAVNDIVTPYELPYQVKDALKRHVPQLLEDGTPDLGAAQPIRFTNRAATFDHSAERSHEFCWAVPQPGRGTDIWVPLAINPAQRDWWDQLLAGDATAGQLQLVHQPRHDRWELHVPLTLPTPDTDVDQDACMPVGVDVGEAILLTGCALQNGRPTEPLLVDGGRTRELHQTLQTTLQRLQERDAATWRIDERAAYFRNVLGDEIETATRRAVDYAAGFEQPVIVLEALESLQEDLDVGPHLTRRLHAWAFDRLQTRLADKAVDAGIPSDMSIRRTRPRSATPAGSLAPGANRRSSAVPTTTAGCRSIRPISMRRPTSPAASIRGVKAVPGTRIAMTRRGAGAPVTVPQDLVSRAGHSDDAHESSPETSVTPPV